MGSKEHNDTKTTTTNNEHGVLGGDPNILLFLCPSQRPADPTWPRCYYWNGKVKQGQGQSPPSRLSCYSATLIAKQRRNGADECERGNLEAFCVLSLFVFDFVFLRVCLCRARARRRARFWPTTPTTHHSRCPRIACCNWTSWATDSDPRHGQTIERKGCPEVTHSLTQVATPTAESDQ
jgi:hypothetical protein